jgi:hypothetical protein
MFWWDSRRKMLCFQLFIIGFENRKAFSKPFSNETLYRRRGNNNDSLLNTQVRIRSLHVKKKKKSNDKEKQVDV